jgi:hypothetical protein
MNEPEFTPQEQDLINRLANAPQPGLPPDAFDAIRARMLDAMDMPTVYPGRRLPGRSLPISAPLLALAAAALVVVVGIVAIFNRPAATMTPTSLPTFTNQPPTVTPPVVIAPTQSVPVEPTQPTQAATTEVAPPSTLTPTLESVIVVEGPVEAINGDIVTIYGIDIALNPDDPLLTVIEVGDVLHVEANYDTTATIIVAVTAEPVSENVNVNPDTGETWRDDGSCANPPPPWAPANGWRRRCEAAPANANPPGNGNGNSGGNGNGNGNGNGQGQDKHDG